MSIFESLCGETDEIKRRVGILNAVPDFARQKVEAILSDKATTSDIISAPQGGVTSITYKNPQGKIILTLNSIDRIDEFGTSWGIVRLESRT